MRVLVLSSVFPNPKQPTLGVFVKERVRRIARHCELRVVAAVSWFPLNRLIRGPRCTGIPFREEQEGLCVYHPPFLCMPRYFKWSDGVLYACSLVPFLVRLRKDFPFELIDAHFAYPDGMAGVLLARLFDCPVTVTLRGTIVPLSSFPVRRREIAWTLNEATRVFAVSHSLKDVAVSLRVPPEKIRVIPNGIDPEAFRPWGQEDARRRLGLPLDRRILLSVGSLSPRKGHHRVLESLRRVIAERPDLFYVVVGGPGVEGDTGPLLRRLIRELRLGGQVRLVGERPHEEIPDWLAAADLFCLATSNEGRPNVILEALACGLPVVTTRVGGNSEVVEEGVNGLLVEFGDREGLARALLRGLVHPWDREAIAEKARARSWDETAAEVLEEFRQLLAGGRGRAGAQARLEPSGRRP
jgi:glycosyltransferase involved in cell wall biosynthesis